MRRGVAAFLLVTIAAAFAGCSHPVAPAISQQTIQDIDSYFWMSNQSQLKYWTDSGQLLGAISFSYSQPILSVKYLNYPIMNCIVNSDSVFASGFTNGSVFDLPSNTYFSGLDTEVFTTLHPRAIAISDNPYIVFVATDSGLYYYDRANSSSFKYGGIGKDTSIDDLLINPAHQVLASTTNPSGYLLGASLTPPFINWSSLPSIPGKKIRQMVMYQGLGGTDTLFARAEGPDGIWISANGNPFTQLPFDQTDSITALGKYQPTSSKFYLLYATSSGLVGAYSQSSRQTATPFTLPASAGTVHCFAATTSTIFAGTDGGIYECTNIDANTWSPILSNYSGVTSIGVESGGYIIFISHGSVFRGNISSGVTQLTTESTPLEVGFSSGMTWALTLDNFDTISASTNQFTPVPELSFWPYSPGGLVLLRNTSVSLNSSWRAGTLVTDNHRSYAITGRLIDHFDSLRVTSTGTSGSSSSSHAYTDVIAVQYANETPSGPRYDTIPYWVVYYAKNVGPVMFDKIYQNPPGSSGPPQIERREISP